jgi:hypothetical protein
MQSSLRLGGAQGVQSARQTGRVASLSPKHAAGRVRRQLRCQAALAPSSSFMGARVARTAAPQYAARRTQTRGRMVVKAMFERFTEKAIKVRWGSDRRLQLAIAAALRHIRRSFCLISLALRQLGARRWRAADVGVFAHQRAVSLRNSHSTASGCSRVQYRA